MRVDTKKSAQQGSVLLEYILVTMMVILPLIGAQEWLLDLSAGETLHEHEKMENAIFTSVGTLDYDQDAINSGAKRINFGVLGNEFVDWYRRLVTGIALPFP